MDGLLVLLVRAVIELRKGDLVGVPLGNGVGFREEDDFVGVVGFLIGEVVCEVSARAGD